MTTNDQKLIQQTGLCWTPKGLRPLYIKGLICFFAGLFLMTCQASGVGTGTTPQEPNLADQQKNDLIIAKMPTTPSARQLWQTRISVSRDEKSSRSKEELQQVIQRLGSMEMKPRVPAPEPKVVVEPTQKTEPNETASVPEAAPTSAAEKIESKLPEGFISEKTLQIFSGQLQQPASLKNPLEMAEILFNSGHLKEAAICYQEALNRLGAEGTDPLQNKAWFLLQWGNCLREENPQAALEKYNSVIVECSDSLWAELAKAQSDLINWQLKDQPKTLVKDLKF